MTDRNNLQIDLIKLVSGERLRRLTEPQSGLSSEKKLAPKRPVGRQKDHWLGMFETARARAELAAA